MVLFDGKLWISCGADPLIRVDAETGQIIDRIDLGTADRRIPGSGHAVDIGLGGVWLANPVGTDDDPIPPHSFSGGVALIDPATGLILRTAVFTDRTPTDVAVGSEFVWLSTGNSITRIDPESMRVKGAFTYEGSVGDIAAEGGSLWAAPEEDGPSAVLRIDESSGHVQARYLEDADASVLLASGGSLWVSLYGGTRLARIDIASERVTVSSPLPGSLATLAVGGGSAWVALYEQGLAVRLDEETLERVDQISVGLYPSALAVGYGLLWVANYVDQLLRRIPLG